ncbi:MAG: hypothetical protein LOD88_07960 [Novibacillus thermophilus]|jgi:hypothetical protein
MNLLDAAVLGFTAFILLYSGYGYLKEKAELPKYRREKTPKDKQLANTLKAEAQ